MPPTRRGSAPTSRPSQIIATDQAAQILEVDATPDLRAGCPMACGEVCTSTCPQAALRRIPAETRALLAAKNDERLDHLALRHYGLPDHARHAIGRVLPRRYGVKALAHRDDVQRWELDLFDAVLAIVEDVVRTAA